MSDSLQPHGLQHARLPCPSLSPGVCSNSYPLNQWCHPTISSSVAPFSSCPQSFPASVFSNELALRIRCPKYWSFSFSISPFNEYSVLISFRIDWFDLLADQGTLKSLLQHYNSKPSILRHSGFLMVWLWGSMVCSTPGFPVLHYLPEFVQTHVHWVGDAIQPSHPLLPLPPLALNLSQHQSFPISQFFVSGGQSIGASASALFKTWNTPKFFYIFYETFSAVEIYRTYYLHVNQVAFPPFPDNLFFSSLLEIQLEFPQVLLSSLITFEHFMLPVSGLKMADSRGMDLWLQSFWLNLQDSEEFSVKLLTLVLDWPTF